MRHWYGVITDENNRYVSHATLKVFTSSSVITGSLAGGDYAITGALDAIYSDDGVTPIDQDGGTFLTTDSVGWAEFWVNAATVVLGIYFDGELKRAVSDVEVDGSGGGGGTGGVPAGPITAGDLTMSSGYVLGRTTAAVGAIELITVGSGLTLAAGSLSANAASPSDINTGTSTTTFVTPDALAGSDLGVALVTLQVTDPAGSAITTGDGKAYYRISSALNGMNLVSVAAALTTVSSSGIPTVQIANVTDSVDMLSTKLTIDASETDSATAATAAVIDAAHDDVATADMLRIDIDVAGTGAKGLIVQMQFRKP
jgi:hypothetical protein